MIDTDLSLEEKYTSMNEIEHILAKSGMYIGSIYGEIIKSNLYKPDINKIVEINTVLYNAGLVKLFDEVFTNSIDERRRKSKLYDITQIDVKIFKSGKVIIKDNGGIPVKIHKVFKEYLPKVLFGQLRTSSNYTEERDGAGINGIGAKIANIYSSNFKLTTSDGIKKIELGWRNNMQECYLEKVTKSNNEEHFSIFEFDIELFRFDNMKEIDISTARLIHKRCIDGAGANPGLKITFETDVNEKLNSEWLFKSFDEYTKLYIEDKNIPNIVNHKFNNGDEVTFVPNSHLNHSFVNGAVCSDSEGTHFKHVRKQINEYILKYLKTKDIELITDKDINSKISYFINFSISNPDYSSQTKEKLTSKISPHHLHLPKEFLSKLDESEIMNQIIDYYNLKYLAEEKKKLRNLNKALKNTKAKKLNSCSSKDADSNDLFLFEGTSAGNGFRSYRDPMHQASYELRGKVRNTLDLSRERILENEEFRELIGLQGLQFLEPKLNLKNVKYNRIIFGTDADVDGMHISGLLLAFYCKHFPELIHAGKIYRLQSPIIIVKVLKTKEEIFFYNVEEYKKREAEFVGKSISSKYEISYFKGLGSLEDHHYEQLIQKPRLLKFKLKDIKEYMKTVELWFGKNAELRKEQLIYDGEISSEDIY